MPGPRFLLTLSLAALAGCQSLGSQEPAAPPAERWQGRLQIAGDQARFTPCADGRRFSLVFPEELLPRAQSLSHGRETLFIDFRGTLAAQAARPDQAGELHLTRLLRLQAEGPDCDDPLFPRLVARASGSEPDWGVEITPQGMLLTRPGEAPVALPYLEEQLPEGRRSFSSEADGQRIELWIAPELCEHAASGTLSSLSATLTLNGETLRGCAYPGGASEG